MISRLLLIITLILGPASQIIGQNPRPFLDRAYNATGALFEDDEGPHSFVCSLVVIDMDPTGLTAVTARHCVDNLQNRPIVRFTANETGHHYLVDKVGWSNQDDVAFIHILGHPKNVYPVYLGEETLLSPGDTILNISYMLNSGKIIVYGQFIAPAFPRPNPEYIEGYGWRFGMPINLLAAPGSSGSPVFDPEREKVIGIVVGIYGRGVPYSIAIRASVIKEMYSEYKNST